MRCIYCGSPSEYVLHMTLCHVPEEDTADDAAVIAKEADVCLPCGTTIIENEARRALRDPLPGENADGRVSSWEDVEVACGHDRPV